MSVTGPRRAARSLVVLLCVAAATALGGCSQQGAASAPRSLTETQAERLAVVRFNDFDAGVRAIRIALPASAGTAAITLTGWMDFAGHLGYASAEQSGSSLGLVVWTPTEIATRETPVTGTPLPIPSDGWSSAAFNAASSDLTAALDLVTNLGDDRPDNPQLLQQSDAALLRSTSLRGTAVDVFAGPSPTAEGAQTATPVPVGQRSRYWVSEKGQLERFQSHLGGATPWTVIDFSAATGITLTIPPGILP